MNDKYIADIESRVDKLCGIKCCAPGHHELVNFDGYLKAIGIQLFMPPEYECAKCGKLVTEAEARFYTFINNVTLRLDPNINCKEKLDVYLPFFPRERDVMPESKEEWWERFFGCLPIICRWLAENEMKNPKKIKLLKKINPEYIVPIRVDYLNDYMTYCCPLCFDPYLFIEKCFKEKNSYSYFEFVDVFNLGKEQGDYFMKNFIEIVFNQMSRKFNANAS